MKHLVVGPRTSTPLLWNLSDAGESSWRLLWLIYYYYYCFLMQLSHAHGGAIKKKEKMKWTQKQLRSPTKSYYRGNFSMLCSSDTLQNNIFSSREAKETLHFRLFCIVSVISGWVLFHLALLKKGTTADSFLSEIWPFGGGGDVAAFYICPSGLDPSPMAAAAAWWAAASERGAPSDVTVTFSSSRRFRQAALGFRLRSGQGAKRGGGVSLVCFSLQQRFIGKSKWIIDWSSVAKDQNSLCCTK